MHPEINAPGSKKELKMGDLLWLASGKENHWQDMLLNNAWPAAPRVGDEDIPDDVDSSGRSGTESSKSDIARLLGGTWVEKSAG